MKKVAVITDATSPDFFFPLWHRYYGGVFGAANLHVVTYAGMKRRFSGIELGNLWEVNAPYDDGLRAEIIPDLVSVLLRSHDMVIRCDADEFLVPDPKQYAGLADFVARNALPYVTARGIDVVEMAEDAPLDFSQPVFGVQRRWGMRATALNKTCVTSVPLRWAAGFHGASAPPVFGGLYLLHGKLADLRMRVAREADLLPGLTAGTHTHRYFSGSAGNLAALQRHTAALPKGGAESEAAFDARFLATIRHDRERGIHQGDFINQDFLIRLDRLLGLPGSGPADLAHGRPVLKSPDLDRWLVDLGALRAVTLVAVHGLGGVRAALYVSSEGQEWVLASAKLDDAPDCVFTLAPPAWTRFLRVEALGEAGPGALGIQVFGPEED